jgi:hypothetical protein
VVLAELGEGGVLGERRLFFHQSVRARSHLSVVAQGLLHFEIFKKRLKVADFDQTVSLGVAVEGVKLNGWSLQLQHLSVSLVALLGQLNMHYLSHVAVVGDGVVLVNVEVLLEQLLQRFVGFLLALLQTQDFERLLFSHEATLDAQTLLSHLLPALVGKLLPSEIFPFALEESQDFSVALGQRQRPNGDLTLKLGSLRLVGVSLFGVGHAHIVSHRLGPRHLHH